MSREWKPGDLADINGSRAMRGDDDRWVWIDGFSSADRDTAHGARPLVVIDPEGNPEGLPYLVPQHFRNYAATLRKNHGPVSAQMLEWLADQLEVFVPSPPKPDEPTGLGAVVEDTEGGWWVRTHPEAARSWWDRRDNTRARYADITAVRVLSEGVPS